MLAITQNGRDGFEQECVQKYNTVVFDAFQGLFEALPLGCILQERILVVHGLIWPPQYTLHDVQTLNRFHDRPPSGHVDR